RFDPRALRFGQLKIDIGAELESDHLPRQNVQARTELNKFNLVLRVVENLRERLVHELELGAIETKRDREFQFFRRASLDQCPMQLAIMIEIARIAVNRLLKIAADVEMAGPRRIGFGLEPLGRRIRRPRDFEKDKELLRVGVLSLIENDAVILFANALRDVWQTEQFGGERDLIGIRDRAARESKVAIITLYVRCHAGSARVRPVAQRPKRLAPAPDKFFFGRRARRPRRKLIRRPPALDPIP